jgi:hypothetical protein
VRIAINSCWSTRVMSAERHTQYALSKMLSSLLANVSMAPWR